MMDGDIAELDSDWEDPLPHALVQPRRYLSTISAQTKAVVVFVHGRGESIDDMVGIFLPTFARRYGGAEGVKDDVENLESTVSFVGLEARDNVWYPQGPVRTSLDAKINGPYCFSALELLRKTILDISTNDRFPISTKNITLVGFSQGAILANAYLLAALERGREKAAPLMPLPAHIFALAGTLFGIKPTFPHRSAFGTAEEKATYIRGIEEECKKDVKAIGENHSITLHLLCGDKDRYFSEKEVRETAEAILLVKEAEKVNDSSAANNLSIVVGIEHGAGHSITERMIAAIALAVDESCA